MELKQRANERRQGRTRGVRDMRTPLKARIRSKPRAEGQEYLDMYVLSRERARWGSLKEHAEQILQGIEGSIEEYARNGPKHRELPRTQ